MTLQVSSEILAKLIMDNPFPQTQLMSVSHFCDFARERAIDLGLEDLEGFEEQGFLYPIVRVQRTFTLFKKVNAVENGMSKPTLQSFADGEHFTGETQKVYDGITDVTNSLGEYLKDGHLIFPSNTNFRPWKEYKDGYEDTCLAFYHPYQSLLIKTIRSAHRNTTAETKYVLKKEGGFFLDIRQKNLFNQIAEYNKLINFLLSIQDIYLPPIRRIFRGKFANNIDQLFDQWFEWKKSFNPKAVLERSELTIDEIKNWRLYFAGEARFIDPIVNWYVLVRHIKYSKRERLRGNALLAQDYYEIVDMLGRFLFDISGEQQLDADDIFDGRWGRWKKEAYGQEKLTYDNREVLKRVLSEFEINSEDRVLLILEGPTENEAVPPILQAMNLDFKKLGIRILPLGGVGEASPERCEKLLEYLALSPTFVIPYLILDNDQDVKKILERYRTKLIHPNNYRIWNTEFEQDNFSEEEIIEAVKKQAEKRGFKNLQLSVELIEEERQAKRSAGKDVQYITKILQKLLHPYEIDKPELGKDLGEMVAERIKNQSKEQKAYIPSTEIEKEIIKIVQLAMTA